MRHLALVIALALVASCAADDDGEADAPGPTVATSPTTRAATTTTAVASSEPTTSCEVPPVAERTHITGSGNRWFEGSLDLTAEPLTVELDGVATWILPLGDGRWHVTLEDGTAVAVTPDATVAPAPAIAGDGPPMVVADADAERRVTSSADELAPFDDPLPDARVVHAGQLSATLVGPTDRYAHAVLGDDVEAGAVEVLDRCTGALTRIEVGPPDVIEGVSPMFADLDGDGTVEVLITTANDETGARLDAYRIDGTPLATSEPIGQGRRWRNQLGVAPLGPNGEIEVVDVQTPHLGGIVRFSRLDGDGLTLQTSIGEFTSHVIGSRNLDLGILADVTADDRPEVLIYTQDRSRLAAIERTAEGAEVTALVELGGRGVTNLAVQDSPAGGTLALGTTDGRLLLWPASAD